MHISFKAFPPLVSVSAIALCLVIAGCSGDAQPPGGPPPRGPVEVVVAKPLVMPIVEWDAYIGRLDAIESVDVMSRVSGYLQSHHFDEGQVVNEGDLLFVIDPRPFEAVYREQETALAEAKAKANEAAAQVNQAISTRDQARARLDLAQQRLNRIRPLVPSGTITQDELDIQESEVRQAEADVAAFAAAIDSAKAQEAAMQAAVESAAARLDSATLEFNYTRIRAPVTGRIGQRLVTKGNYVTGGLGGNVLTTIVSLDPIHCYFDANERELLKYTRLAESGARESSRDAKNPAYMALVDEEGFPHKGHMDFVDNRVDQATGTMRGRAIFPNQDMVLTPGMFANVRIPGSGRYDAVLIPDAAVAVDQAQQFVYVVGEDNKVKRAVVELGPMAHDLRVVRSGLDPSATIVISGVQSIAEGAQVKPIEQPLEAGPGGDLPDDFKPVPKEEWLTPKRAADEEQP